MRRRRSAWLSSGGKRQSSSIEDRGFATIGGGGEYDAPLIIDSLGIPHPAKPRENCIGTPHLPLMLANGVILAMTFPSDAEDGNFFGFQSLAGNPKLSLGRNQRALPTNLFCRQPS